MRKFAILPYLLRYLVISSEFSLIEKIFQLQAEAIASDPHVLLGIGDDAAVVQPYAEENLVFSTDSLISGVHFLPDADPRWLGYKSLAVNLSDLAAMGAHPRWFLLSLTLPEINETWLREFFAGLFQLAHEHLIQLIGGNTARGPLNINIQIVGTVKNKGLTRGAAQADDDIWVTGFLGAGYQPHSSRIAVGLALRELAHAAIDLSDGLLGDLPHICQASQLGADIFLEKIPIDSEVKKTYEPMEALRLALTAGEDYELCFTVAKNRRVRIVELFEQLGLSVSLIGQMRPGSGVCYYSNNQMIDLSAWHGFEHFTSN